MNKELVELLNLEDNIPDIKKVKLDPNDEWEFSRNNIMQVMSKGNDALDELMSIAKASQHPGAYEMIVGLVKELVNGNKVLMETKRIDQQIKLDEVGANKQTPDQNAQTINNNIFLGTTAAFAKIAEEYKNKIINGEPLDDN